MLNVSVTSRINSGFNRLVVVLLLLKAVGLLCLLTVFTLFN
jgi:hypothetical protein